MASGSVSSPVSEVLRSLRSSSELSLESNVIARTKAQLPRRPPASLRPAQPLRHLPCPLRSQACPWTLRQRRAASRRHPTPPRHHVRSCRHQVPKRKSWSNKSRISWANSQRLSRATRVRSKSSATGSIWSKPSPFPLPPSAPPSLPSLSKFPSRLAISQHPYLYLLLFRRALAVLL